jgi:hypothetical protein
MENVVEQDRHSADDSEVTLLGLGLGVAMLCEVSVDTRRARADLSRELGHRPSPEVEDGRR